VQQEDDAMAGGNFDDPLTIDSSGKILPTGALLEFTGGVGMQLRFWVIQFQDGRNGAYMAAKGQPQAKDPTKWETLNDATVFRNGIFRPGQASATAVVTLTSGVISWWNTTILLS
jgi:hypothetical protein